MRHTDELGELIRAGLKKKDMSQSELGVALNTSHGIISKLISGRLDSKAKWEKIVRFLDIDIREFERLYEKRVEKSRNIFLDSTIPSDSTVISALTLRKLADLADTMPESCISYGLLKAVLITIEKGPNK